MGDSLKKKSRSFYKALILFLEYPESSRLYFDVMVNSVPRNLGFHLCIHAFGMILLSFKRYTFYETAYGISWISFPFFCPLRVEFSSPFAFSPLWLLSYVCLPFPTSLFFSASVRDILSHIELISCSVWALWGRHIKKSLPAGLSCRGSYCVCSGPREC